MKKDLDSLLADYDRLFNRAYDALQKKAFWQAIDLNEQALTLLDNEVQPLLPEPAAINGIKAQTLNNLAASQAGCKDFDAAIKSQRTAIRLTAPEDTYGQLNYKIYFLSILIEGEDFLKQVP